MSTDGQGSEQWKQKYYDQLDRLEQKEKDWEQLETTLKRTIGRLSLAAEGQNKTLDRHIDDLRTAIKNNINRQRLESVIDDISRVLTQLEDKQVSPNRLAVDLLEQLVSKLTLPASNTKQQKKLVKKLSKANDDDRDSLIKETISLLKNAITTDSSTAESSGLLGRLFSSDKTTPKEDKTDSKLSSPDIKAITNIIEHLLTILPWPESIKDKSLSTIESIKKSDSETSLLTSLNEVEALIKQWPDESPGKTNKEDISKELPGAVDTLSAYKSCLINLLNNLDNTESPSGKLTALKISARDAKEESELIELSSQLSKILLDKTSSTDIPETTSEPVTQTTETITTPSIDGPNQPSIQELLIRLLEQLIVPSDLKIEADKMKQRLEKDTDPTNWKQLLKDVALLINSIRSRMQKEKHEFEDFLQQVTDRLKTMDQFLQTETSSLKEAQSIGKEFDDKINNNVSDIRQDVNQATELASLKDTVSTKLDTISNHIVNYREYEVNRVEESQQQVYNMQTKMLSLEKETETLKHIVIEKNRQAMFDALTEIPNRLSYEKRIEDEISRWKRFNTPLSLAIWDIDFFKKVNDTYGHKAGDKVLKTVAQLLNKRIRATDFLARYGGEEFVMLLPGTKQEETLRLVNDLREQVQACGFHYHGEAVTITVSCGVSSFNEGDVVEKVFERADQALYKAKKNGRNQCVVASCLSD